ncbi:hypothetical protein N8I77_007137 [Diaporthe amygdali]|uniref:Secreted protein n=1 Tax=Phomopsis amygdali TaxID=1214568 RepID=A0AAD9SC90_PHOAM|nr:hypothetical protein N8I77_007137 [Diaporthe amygdali]
MMYLQVHLNHTVIKMQFTNIIIALALQTAAVLAAPPVSPEDAAVNAAVPHGIIESMTLMHDAIVLRMLLGTTDWLRDLLQLKLFLT